MSEDNDPYAEYEEFDNDVGVDVEDKQYGENKRDAWFKGETGRTYRTSLVYFHSADVIAVRALKAKARKDSSIVVDRDKILAVAQAALKKRAEALDKSADALTPGDKLDLSQVRFKRFEAHYKEDFGFAPSRLGKDGPEADKIWNMLGEKKDYFTTALLIYPTDNDGDIDKDRLTKGCKIVPWRFARTIYERIWALNDGLRANDLSIANQDLSMKCVDAKFHKFQIDPKGKAIWRSKDRFRDMILASAVPVYDKLVPFRDMSTADLKIKLGISDNTGDDVSEDDMNDLLDSV